MVLAKARLKHLVLGIKVQGSNEARQKKVPDMYLNSLLSYGLMSRGISKSKMEFYAIEIEENDYNQKRKSVMNGESTSSQGQTTAAWPKLKPLSDGSISSRVSRSRWEEESKKDEASYKDEALFESSLALIERRLEGRHHQARGENGRCSNFMFRVAQSMLENNYQGEQPEVVSIGPYHRGKDHLLGFEERKWSLLEKFLSRIGKDLSSCLHAIWKLQNRTKIFYSDRFLIISSHDFLEMMLLDGCFVVELLWHLGCAENTVERDDSIFPSPWLTGVLIRDLLREDNQLPYFLLQTLFQWSQCDDGESTDSLPMLALKVFGLSFSMTSEAIIKCRNFEGKHLLDLFRLSFLPFDHARSFSPSPCFSSSSASDPRQDRNTGHRTIGAGAKNAQPTGILQNGASSDQLEVAHRGQESVTRIWAHQQEYEFPEVSESYSEEDETHNNRAETTMDYSLALISRSLSERRGVARQRGRRNLIKSIFRIPHKLVGVNDKAQQPELVSIGPYHRGKDYLLEFEEHKWSFLERFLSRTRGFGMELRDYLELLRAMEEKTRECYSEVVLMSMHDFLEMMLLDGCFLIEVLCHLGSAGDVFEDDDPLFTRPWLIPVLISDLLKLENQLPFFVLDSLFTGSRGHELGRIDSLTTTALKVFNLVFPNSLESINKGEDLNPKHLLDLFRLSVLPPKPVVSYPVRQEYRPSGQSVQCVTQLRPSGIMFKRKRCYSFLEIDFRNRVLEIPSITINDFTSTVLINCVALEQCLEFSSKYFTNYVSFMNCLINQPRDVAFLCSDGIITGFSQDDQYVANFFNNLGKNVVFDIRHCYLSKQITEVEAYYSSNWATMMRTYFSSPWSFISLSSAIFLICLTMVQTIISVLAYKS